MSESKGATKAVDRMVEAIRADEPPEPNWDAIERSLLLRIRRGEGARRAAQPSSGAWQVLAFAAAAAVIPIALSIGGHTSQPPIVAEEIHAVDVERVGAATGDASARNLAALHSGDAVEATTSAVTFADAGKVRWTLSPDSRLVVRAPVPSSGIGHVVRLERGSLRVEVQPDLVTQGLVDVLAVEVGNTRVAVHGTAFTVTLRDGEVLVDVEHGVVTVGPTGQRGATTGYQLAAGSRAAFSIDGAKRARWLRRHELLQPEPIAAVSAPRPDVEAPAAVVTTPDGSPYDDASAVVGAVGAPAAHAAKSAPAAKAAPADTNADASAEKPADVEEPAVQAPAAPLQPLMTVGAVQAGLQRCFVQAHPITNPTAPKLTATSTLKVTVSAEGSVQGVKFEPALPTIQGCAGFVWSGKFAPGAATHTLAIPVNLSQ